MCTDTTGYRCELRNFVADLLTFVEEQITQALAEPSDQLAAIDAASGAVPILRKRLYREDQTLLTQFMLVLSDNSFDTTWWADLAKKDRAQFCEDARSLLDQIAQLQALIDCPAHT